jgi:transcription elongation factor Elf1
MVEEDEYFECPVCGWFISFRFDYDKQRYISFCPYCQNRLEMDKEEMEKEEETYFEFGN